MHPESITIDGATYSVVVHYGCERCCHEDDIEFLQLKDPEGIIFFETDWEGSFSESDILMMME